VDRQRFRSIVGGSAGNLVEWYDWYAYASLSLYFAPAFFPAGDRTAQLLNTAAIFGAGFLMRPVGAWVIGRFADQHGRKAGLALSVALMAGGSLLIACAPGYGRIGVLAPVLLLVARIIQGFSVGAEYGSSATYLSEAAPRAQRGFWSSFHYVSLIMGQLLSLAVLILLQTTLGEQALGAWGWRVPFVVGAVLACVVYLLRQRIAETESFRAMPAERTRSTAAILWRDHRREALLVAVITAGGSLAFYAYTTYMQKFLVNTSGFSKPSATGIMTAALLVFLVLQPVFGALADRLGRKPMLYLFGIGGMLATVPVFNAIAVERDHGAALALVMVPLTALSAYTAIAALLKAELFPAHIRTLGVALPYAIGNTLFGGTAEYIALWLKRSGSEAAFYWYVTAVLGVATIAFAMLPETKLTSLIAED
jgi:MHS family alpha-ketoglutarate permease-like MFS transporter